MSKGKKPPYKDIFILRMATKVFHGYARNQGKADKHMDRFDPAWLRVVGDDLEMYINAFRHHGGLQRQGFLPGMEGGLKPQWIKLATKIEGRIVVVNAQWLLGLYADKGASFNTTRGFIYAYTVAKELRAYLHQREREFGEFYLVNGITESTLAELRFSLALKGVAQ